VRVHAKEGHLQADVAPVAPVAYSNSIPDIAALDR
jgi:hypothetical protein